ncbi:hypothetical protein, partial [Dietzia sp. SLG310A2-38A2]|uniref:hypothetical protein n=1 Tax=Dietzia sp. SLG310A2-38A2 TaxID=1630643 RepID=UPI0019D6881F
RGEHESVFAQPDWEQVHREMDRVGVTLSLLHGDYLSIRRFESHRLLRLGATVIAVESRWLMGWEPPALVRRSRGLVHGGVFAHVEGAGLDPEGVVDDAVHDGVVDGG